jgi:Amt family ammonium transporter
MGFVFAVMFAFFKVLDMLVGIRVTEQEEICGLDIGENGMVAFPDFEIPA